MSDSKTLHGEEALAKMREIIGHSPTCHFLSGLDQRPIPARPMHTVEVDDLGAFWFLGSTHTDLVEDLMKSAEVQLLYANPEEAEYLTVFGHATVVRDEGRMAELRSRRSAGPITVWSMLEEKDACAIKVEPQNSYYRDAKGGKATTVLSMMVAGVFGQKGNEAVKGPIITPKG